MSVSSENKKQSWSRNVSDVATPLYGFNMFFFIVVRSVGHRDYAAVATSIALFMAVPYRNHSESPPSP